MNDQNHASERVQINYCDTLRMNTGDWNGLYRVVLVLSNFDTAFLYEIGPIQALADSNENGSGKSNLQSKVSARGPRSCKLSWLNDLPEHMCSKVDFILPEWTSKSPDLLNEKQRKLYLNIKERTDKLSAPHFLDALFFEKKFSKKIEEFAVLFNVNRTTLARDLSRYFLCECDVNKAAMYAIFARRPANPVQRKVKEKLGRKFQLAKSGHNPNHIGINVDEAIKTSIKDHLLSCKDRIKVSVAELFSSWREKYVHRLVSKLANGVPVYDINPKFDISYSQFNYQLQLIESLRQSTLAKIGLRRFSKDRRILTSHARHLVEYPGQHYIIDSTVADIYLVSAFDRRLLIGRPTIFIIIDAFSSLIVSIHITLEAPSLEQAQIALYRAVTPKTRLLTKLGVESLMEYFPQACKPLSVFSDRGELLSNGARKMSERFQVSQTIAPPYKPEFKALVERMFGVFNGELHRIRGGVRQRYKERGERDVRHDAELTIPGLYRVLLRKSAEWNSTKDMMRHESGRMLRGDVQPTPLGFWNYGIEKLHGSAKFCTNADAVRLLLPTVKAVADRRGLHVNQLLRFTADWMREEDDFYLQSHVGNGNIYLDPDDAMRAFWLHPTSNELEELQLVDTRQYDEAEMFIDDIEEVEAYLKLVSAETLHLNKGAKATFQQSISAELRREGAATSAAKESDTRSKTRRVNSIKANRKLEFVMSATPAAPTKARSSKVDSPDTREPDGLDKAYDDIFGDFQ
jgi:putative transposase